MLLVDSSVWIDYFNGTITPQTNHLDTILGIDEIVIGDLILAEVLQGFRLDKDYEAAKKGHVCVPNFKSGWSKPCSEKRRQLQIFAKAWDYNQEDN